MEKIPSTTESVTDNVSRLLDEVHKRMDILEFHEKMVAFAKKIQKNHPDFHRYRCYHKLIGSTLPKNTQNIIERDFEGEDSVVAFLENIIQN